MQKGEKGSHWGHSSIVENSGEQASGLGPLEPLDHWTPWVHQKEQRSARSCGPRDSGWDASSQLGTQWHSAADLETRFDGLSQDLGSRVTLDHDGPFFVVCSLKAHCFRGGHTGTFTLMFDASFSRVKYV